MGWHPFEEESCKLLHILIMRFAYHSNSMRIKRSILSNRIIHIFKSHYFESNRVSLLVISLNAKIRVE